MFGINDDTVFDFKSVTLSGGGYLLYTQRLKNYATGLTAKIYDENLTSDIKLTIKYFFTSMKTEINYRLLLKRFT